MNLLNNQIFVSLDKSKSDLCGTIMHNSLPEMKYFSGIEQLLKWIDVIMKQPGFPESTVKYRSFKDGEKKMDKMPMEFTTEHGEKATFVVSVMYCQNATWQGTVKWLEGGRTEKFRSLLELIKLMDSTIEESQSEESQSEESQSEESQSEESQSEESQS